MAWNSTLLYSSIMYSGTLLIQSPAGHKNMPALKGWPCLSSVLTRILPCRVPGPPLLRNNGPVRTSGGQCYSKWSVTWSTYLIQYGGQGLYDSITVHTPIFTAYVETIKLTAIKLKTRSFNNMFFTHLMNKQNAGFLGWPLKLLI